jgi:hypothetical protein
MNGTEIWSFPHLARSSYVSTPACTEDRIYFADVGYVVQGPGFANTTSVQSHLYSLDYSGKELWNISVRSMNPVAVSDDGTIVVLGSEGLWGVGPNGTLKWTIGPDSGWSRGFAVKDNTIYVVHNATLLGISTSGVVIFEREVGLQVGTLLVDRDHIYAAAPGYLNDATESLLIAFDRSGDELWRVNATDSPTPTSVSSNGIVILSGGWSLGTVVAIDSNGSRLWSVSVGTMTGWPVIGSNGAIYVLSDNGLLMLTPGLSSSSIAIIISIAALVVLAVVTVVVLRMAPSSLDKEG